MTCSSAITASRLGSRSSSRVRNPRVRRSYSPRGVRPRGVPEGERPATARAEPLRPVAARGARRPSQALRAAPVIDPSGRVSFDRAAEFYDQTRALPAAALDGVVDLLGAELEGRGRCLEIGVGTGRIALPLSGAGVPMAGVDVSAQMVARLLEKSGG